MYSSRKASIFGALLLGGLLSLPASAVQITFAGSANGNLMNDGTATNCPGGTTTDVVASITFTCQPSFSVTSSSIGLAAFGGQTTGDNFGTFTLATTTQPVISGPFTLTINFTLPTGTNPNPANFAATFIAEVTNSTNGGLVVDFVNNQQNFTFASAPNAPAGGTFTLSVNDVSVTPGNTAAVTGQILVTANNPIPEPGSMALMGTGFLGLALASRRFLGRKA
jgi:hypothetical protein